MISLTVVSMKYISGSQLQRMKSSRGVKKATSKLLKYQNTNGIEKSRQVLVQLSPNQRLLMYL